MLPYGNDSVRTTDGFQCSAAVAPRGYVDFGVYQEESGRYEEPDRGAYARVLVPFGGGNRLDCSKLYEQELKLREREKALSDLKDKVFGE